MEEQKGFYIYLTFRKKGRLGFTAIVRCASHGQAEELKGKYKGYSLSEAVVKQNIPKFSANYDAACEAWLKSVFGHETKTFIEVK